MDGSRGHQLWDVQHQIGCLVLWDPPDRNSHLRKNTIPRYGLFEITLYSQKTAQILLCYLMKKKSYKVSVKVHAFFLSSSGMTNPEVIRSLDRSYRMPCPDGCPEELYDIMMVCWKQKPDDRPTFEYLQNTLNDFFIATEGQYEMQP